MVSERKNGWIGRLLTTAALAMSLSLGACAGGPTPALSSDDPYDANDPLESVNRAVFDFNLGVDAYVLKPTAKAYRTVLPEEVRSSVRNFMNNLRSPIILANDVLQGEFTRAGQTFTRMFVNTTFGIGGLFDVGAKGGIPYHNEDFGQTLAVWGIPEGPYLMLPIFGPSNPRDTLGLVAEYFADPLNVYLRNIDLDYVAFARGLIDAVDARSRNIETFDQLEKTSLDYYATIRSLYRQRRNAEILNKVDDAKKPTSSLPVSDQPTAAIDTPPSEQ